MTQLLMNHIPDYLDDRLKVTVVLSGDIQYLMRTLAQDSTVSSWYDPDEERAFTTTKMSEVPERFRDKLVRHSNGTGSSILMYPDPDSDRAVNHVDSGTSVWLNANPTFTGDSFRVWWDVRNRPGEYETFSASDPISDHPHDYGAYGEYVIAFSTNVTGFNMNRKLAVQFTLYQNGTAATTPYFCSSTKTLKFKKAPYFEGDTLSVVWYTYSQKVNGVNVSFPQLSVYGHDSPLSDYQYEYPDYDEYVGGIYMNSSGGFVSVDVPDGFPDESGLVFVKAVESRVPSHVKTNDLTFCRTVERVECSRLESVTTKWYDCYELTSVRLPELTSIDEKYAINCSPKLQEVYAPRLKCITRATSTFKGNTGMLRADYPELTSIRQDIEPKKNYATFSANMSLSSAYMPKLRKGNPKCFEFCVNLRKTDFRSLSAVESSMFYDCLSLKDISVSPDCSYVGTSAFYRCGQLRRISPLGQCGRVESDAFGFCASLSAIEIPQASVLLPAAFRGCSSLMSVRLENVKAIHNTVFCDCSSLAVVDLSELDYVPQLSNADAFARCPASVLVRPDMVDEFKTKSGDLYKWSDSSMKDRIVAAN